MNMEISYGKVSTDFETALKDSAKDGKINRKELNILKEKAGTDSEKAIVTMLSENKQAVNFEIEDSNLSTAKSSGTSEAHFSLDVDLGDDVQPDKKEVPDLEHKKWNGYTKENSESFNKAFNLKAGTNSLDKAAELLLSATFSKESGGAAKELQKLIGDNPSDGKIGAKTFFLLKEYIANKVNNTTNLEQCEKIKSQLHEITTYFPNLADDPRLKEIEGGLKQKTAFFLNNKINDAKTLEQCKSLKNQIEDMKADLPDNNQLKDNLNKKTEAILEEKLSKATNYIGFILISEEITKLKKDMPETKLSESLNKKVNEFLKSGIEGAKELGVLHAFKEYLRTAGADFPGVDLTGLADNLASKAKPLLNKLIEGTKSTFDKGVLINALEFAKQVLPAADFADIEKRGRDKINKIELFGEDKNGKMSGLVPDSVKQGTIGDCYFLSSLAGLAKTHPEKIMEMITPSLDGKTFTVKFPGSKKTITVSRPTDDELMLYAKMGVDNCLWPAIMEKAWAIHENGGTNGNPYKAIDGGHSSNSGIEILTGSSTDSDIMVLTSKSEMRQKLKNATDKELIVTASTVMDGDAKKKLVAGHAYTILSYDPKTDTVRVRNPHGNGSDAIGIKYPDKNDDGTFTLTIDELNHNFSCITYEEK